ncbi:hypothetical protein [Nonomuraea sp. N2-4H]|uniref:hypothetical protein n=1 Tax=Nonomuraea sp. N2-4H TaxID=3128898 RepID=UPI003872BC97
MSPAYRKIENGSVSVVSNSTNPRMVPIRPRVLSTYTTGMTSTWPGMKVPARKNSMRTRKRRLGLRAITYAAGAASPTDSTLTATTNSSVIA